MHTKTKADTYNEYMNLGMYNMLCSLILEDDPDDAWQPEEAWDARDELSLSDLLLLSAANWDAIAQSFYDSGPGSRGPYDGIPKSLDFFSCCLRAPDRSFRHMFRMGRDTFDRLVALLAENPIFTSKGKKPQKHVKYQLGAFLVRYACRGSDTLWTAQKLGIGFGSVFNYCRRVMHAIRELRDRFLGWPTPERKEEIANAIFVKSGGLASTGFINCLGCGDGSLVRFCQPPFGDGYAFQTRKKFSGTNIQATCDHEGRITSYDLGHPGSVPDVTVWKESHLWQNRHDYFQRGEYILVDKGYPSSPFVLRPFTEPEVANATPQEHRRMRDFNACLSSIRIVSEHAFGRLKGRFPSLKDFGPHESILELYMAIEALLILHNICIDWKDNPEYIWRYNPADPPRDNEEMPSEVDPDDPEDTAANINVTIAGGTPIPTHETDEWLKEEGYRMRRAVLDRMFPATNYP